MSKILVAITSIALIAIAIIKPAAHKKSTKEKETIMQPSPSPSQNNQSLQKPELFIDQAKEYTATLKTTEGDITIKLDAKNTPITTNNFVYLAQKDFYNDTIFHRVIEDFMIQGGDPKGNGTGGPGYKFKDEPIHGEYTRGTVAMANSGPNTNGSQFFIIHQDFSLPKNYVIFGQVTQGIEVVDKIATAEVTQSASGEKSKPINPVKIKTVTINSTNSN